MGSLRNLRKREKVVLCEIYRLLGREPDRFPPHDFCLDYTSVDSKDIPLIAQLTYDTLQVPPDYKITDPDQLLDDFNDFVVYRFNRNRRVWTDTPLCVKDLRYILRK